MQVKIARWYSITMVVLGIVLTVVNLWLMSSSGRFQMGIILGPMIFLFGFLGLYNALFVWNGRELEMRNVLGMTLRRVPLSELEVADEERGRMLYRVRDNGKRRKLVRDGWFLWDKEGSKNLIDTIEAQLAH